LLTPHGPQDSGFSRRESDKIRRYDAEPGMTASRIPESFGRPPARRRQYQARHVPRQASRQVYSGVLHGHKWNDGTGDPYLLQRVLNGLKRL
jgi:hypothetical protein